MAPQIRRTDSDHPDFIRLYGKLTEFLAVLNGDQDTFYAQFNRVDGLPTVVLAYQEDIPIGCGAFRANGDGTVEIKRMYVEPAARGQGAGAAVLRELEVWATELGYAKAILETSRRLESAVRLYRRGGYEEIPNYGPYVDVADSVCFAKRLPSA
ncbi:MAG: GNAT family N-acetyltransferase [Fimbriimonas sp.]